MLRGLSIHNQGKKLNMYIRAAASKDTGKQSKELQCSCFMKRMGIRANHNSKSEGEWVVCNGALESKQRMKLMGAQRVVLIIGEMTMVVVRLQGRCRRALPPETAAGELLRIQREGITD